MKQRGAALPTVLALVTAVLVIGLAMGSLSTLSLQFNRRQLDDIRAEMVARSAVATFVAKLHEKDVEAGIDPLNPEPYRVIDKIDQSTVFKDGNYVATIHFGSAAGFSTDNLGGDEAMVGSPDLADEVKRIPPFTLDLVVNVEGPSGISRFRVGLRRIWPYALYTKLGPVVLMGDPTAHEDSKSPTTVKGDVYTSWNGGAVAGGVTDSGYGLDHFNTPFDVLAFMEARAGLHPTLKPGWPLIIGQVLARNPDLEPDDESDQSTDDTHFFYFRAGPGMPKIPSQNPKDPIFAPSGAAFTNGGNTVVGDFNYAYEDEQQIPLEPMVVPTPLNILEASTPPGGPPTVPNDFDGDSKQRRPLAVDPLKNEPGKSSIDLLKLEPPKQPLAFADGKLEEVYALTDTASIVKDKRGDDEPFLLTEDLDLENGHFEINGSLTNRQIISFTGTDNKGPGLYVRENRAGMKLQNALLHVKGDLDLGASSFDGTEPEEQIAVIGAGATIKVDGKLILGNANINAQDQGFVIYAEDIVLKGGGNFYGLMIANNSISILSRGETPLNIQGALLCQGRGGITLRGTNLEHNPEYLKTINGGGDFGIVSWKKLEP